MSEDIITKYNEFYTYYSIEDFEKLLNSQQRIDKAIDILKNISEDVVVNDRYNEIAKSLSILKGEDK